MQAPRRVVVTGFGVVGPCGTGKTDYWNGLLGEGWTSGPVRRIVDFDPTPLFDNPKEVRRADRVTQFALAAAAMALEDSGDPPLEPLRKGVFVATGVGGLESLEEQIKVRLEKGERRVSPFLVPMMMANASGAAISMRYGWQGPCETVATACAASTHAIGNAARTIAWGRCDAVIAGGAEACLTPTALAAFANMTALSSSGRSMPFDADRDGFVMSEGAALVVMEDLETARGRGAHIYGEILGAASTADAHHITAPSPGGAGAVACMELALLDAGLRPSDIGHINAHGTSTPLNDAAEAEAIRKLFDGTSPPVVSIKGVTGHSLGAAGALEAVAVLLSFEHALIPPTAGTTRLDPDMDIDLVLGEPRPWSPAPVISNSFGFGGHNAVLCLEAV
jgi:3-oxoacyl-[acyl-carrier-protein] synthase II